MLIEVILTFFFNRPARAGWLLCTDENFFEQHSYSYVVIKR